MTLESYFDNFEVIATLESHFTIEECFMRLTSGIGIKEVMKIAEKIEIMLQGADESTKLWRHPQDPRKVRIKLKIRDSKNHEDIFI